MKSRIRKAIFEASDSKCTGPAEKQHRVKKFAYKNISVWQGFVVHGKRGHQTGKWIRLMLKRIHGMCEDAIKALYDIDQALQRVEQVLQYVIQALQYLIGIPQTAKHTLQNAIKLSQNAIKALQSGISISQYAIKARQNAKEVSQNAIKVRKRIKKVSNGNEIVFIETDNFSPKSFLPQR